MKKIKRILIILLCALVFTCGCAVKDDSNTDKSNRGLTDYAFSSASLSGTDRENRVVEPKYSLKTDRQRYVGVFYWLWAGNNDHQFGVYDNTQLMSTPEGREALYNTTNPPGDGMKNASPVTYMHWTNQPLFGYYNMSDPWIVARHIEMLTMADIDYIFFDTTNTYTYSVNKNQNPEVSNLKGAGINVLDTLLEYYDQGWDVPKVAFYTNNSSGDMAQKIYDEYYKSGKYEDLWFKPEGKPLFIGTTENNQGGSDMTGSDLVYISEGLQEYFDVKESVWPFRPSIEAGFPWMSWEYPQHFHEVSKSISVSVAQHSKTDILFSLMHKWSSKGYDYHTDTVEENWLAGKNFENEWETVFTYESQGKEIEFVNVTGWNEWVTQKTYDASYKKAENPTGLLFVDNFTAEYSRDIEPDKDYYKDNIYMQLVRNVRNYKYYSLEEVAKIQWGKKTIRSISDFNTVKAVYKDFVGDARERDYYGFDIRKTSKEEGRVGAWYSDFSNRNDIKQIKVAGDNDNLYFLVQTVNDITEYESGDNWMNILIKTKSSTKEYSFEGYDYIINRSPNGSTTSIEKSNGGWDWSSTGNAEIEVSGNNMFVTIPLSSLNISYGEAFEFKVADNVVKPSWFNEEDAEHDIMHYYVTGDSAPIGRLNFSYWY